MNVIDVVTPKSEHIWTAPLVSIVTSMSSTFLKLVNALLSSVASDKEEMDAVVRPRNPSVNVSSEVHPPTRVHVPVVCV